MTRRDPRLPANRVIRRARLRPETIRVRQRRRVQFRPRPWMVLAAFAAVIAIGTLLLSLPAAAESRSWTSVRDALFTATSAVCVTGLVRVDTADHWSGFGEAVIAALIHLGGLGVTVYAGLVVLVIGGRFGLRGRTFFGFELIDPSEHDIRAILRRMVVFIVIVELTTFLLLLPWVISDVSGPRAVWVALFHSVSAFNNAGFDLQGGRAGFAGLIDSPYPLAIMGSSAFLGSLSFITVFQLRRRPRLWTLDTRLVLIGMAAFVLLGVGVFLVGESQDGRVLDGLSAGGAAINAFFLSINRTTGMSTVDMSALREATTVALLVPMFVGGASTSNASGIKLGTFMVLVVAVWAALRGRHRAEAFGRIIPAVIVLRAVAVITLGLATLVVGTWALALTDEGPLTPLVFEVMSALANVGWSQGLTPGLSVAGSLIVSALMFVGRLGPLMIALSIPERPLARYRYPEAAVRIG